EAGDDQRAPCDSQVRELKSSSLRRPSRAHLRTLAHPKMTTPAGASTSGRDRRTSGLRAACMYPTVTGSVTEYPSPRGKATNGSGEGRRRRLEASSSGLRLAPSPDA